MAGKKKTVKTIIEDTGDEVKKVEEKVEKIEEIEKIEEKIEEIKEVEEKIEEKIEEKVLKTGKFKIGDIVFIKKDTEADLEGFKLFPQYKKYTYTVEAYDADRAIYSLRRLNLSLKLKESNIVAPGEREGDLLIRRQF